MLDIETRQAIKRSVESLSSRARELSLAIHSNPELAFEEIEASRAIIAWLVEEGFNVQQPVAGLPTAFVASWGTGSPRLAYLVEYDALPGLGHGCGHNLIAAGGLCAATALRRATPPAAAGTVLVVGTPAEERGGGKVIEIENGVFEGVDAALMFHPGDRDLLWRDCLANVHLEVTFRGTPSHAAKNPSAGRSALAAVMQMFTAIDSMRQHIPDQARIAGIITNGGAAANIVPELTAARVDVRDRTIQSARSLADRVRLCAQGAAIATETKVVVSEVEPPYANRIHNENLARCVGGYLTDAGIVAKPGIPGEPSGSSDSGNVSQVLPTVHPFLKIVPGGTPGHSPAVREAAASEAAHEAMLGMAYALACTGAEMLENPVLVQEVWREFRERAGAAGEPLI